jgi:hypothetical protein
MTNAESQTVPSAAKAEDEDFDTDDDDDLYDFDHLVSFQRPPADEASKPAPAEVLTQRQADMAVQLPVEKLAQQWQLPAENIFAFDFQRALAQSILASQCPEQAQLLGAPDGDFARLRSALAGQHALAVTKSAAMRAQHAAKQRPRSTKEESAQKVTPCSDADEKRSPAYVPKIFDDSPCCCEELQSAHAYVPKAVVNLAEDQMGLPARLAAEAASEAAVARRINNNMREAEEIAALARAEQSAEAARVVERSAQSAAQRPAYVPKVLLDKRGKR